VDADDLKAIRKAVDDAAAVGGGLWLSFPDPLRCRVGLHIVLFEIP